ncbi:hypothetical protein IGI04_033418 [Brassica rapa subsp. trilocularis]|uniref:Calmodulin-binding domain-containing protein n=1 Tax=Brassica rapa subsp. trilocularis TaxID=1813537 RepID=A0ABQ7L5U8_BRACM|nr:hypothetical protein IGI04_033418 [Brassica rapa subsp. trilocularis]
MEADVVLMWKSTQVDEEEILKVESGVQVLVDGIEESRVKENKEVHVEALHGDESVDEDETSEKVDIDMNSKEVESVEEATEAKEEVNKEENVNVKDEEKEKVKEEEKSGDGKKREVVKGKKESPSAYNDVIASKMQQKLQNPRKNKVLALAGAFQTVIDYETAASK